MKKRDSIYHLIRIMSEAEKSYFIKYGFKNTPGEHGKLQLNLFRQIAKKETADDESLKKQLFSDSPEQFRIIKHHLFNRIIATLNELHTSGIEVYVTEKLRSARTLISKGLFDAAESHANKAYTEALLAERFDLAYSSLQVLKDAVSSIILNEQAHLRFTEIAIQKTECLKKLSNLNEYQQLFDQLKWIESRTGNMDYTEGNKERGLDSIRKSPLLQNISEALSFEAVCVFYLCWSYLHNAEKNTALRNETALLLVKHIESAPGKMKYYQSKYRAAINQYLNSCFPLQHFDSFDYYLDKLVDKGKLLDANLAARNFLIVANLRLNKNFALEQIRENLTVIHNFENEIELHEKHLKPVAFQALYANCMITYFHEAHYRKALPYINKILNTNEENSHATGVQMARCLNCVVHFELNNTELLEYLLKVYGATPNAHPVLLFLTAAIPVLQRQKNPDLIKLKARWQQLCENPNTYKFLTDIYLDRWVKKRIGRS